MKFAIDTTVLAAAEGVDDLAARERALALIARLSGPSALVPVQVLGELHRVLIVKARRSRAATREAIERWRTWGVVVPTDDNALLDAMDLCERHGFQTWDALIVAVSRNAGCRALLSEDMQDGFVWRGMTILNPFASEPNPVLRTVIEAGRY